MLMLFPSPVVRRGWRCFAFRQSLRKTPTPGLSGCGRMGILQEKDIENGL